MLIEGNNQLTCKQYKCNPRLLLGGKRTTMAVHQSPPLQCLKRAKRTFISHLWRGGSHSIESGGGSQIKYRDRVIIILFPLCCGDKDIPPWPSIQFAKICPCIFCIIFHLNIKIILFKKKKKTIGPCIGCKTHHMVSIVVFKPKWAKCTSVR